MKLSYKTAYTIIKNGRGQNLTFWDTVLTRTLYVNEWIIELLKYWTI